MYLKNRIIPLLFVGGSILSVVSCNKKLDTNLTDPNGAGINQLTGKDVFSQTLTSAAANKTGNNISTGSANYDYANQWMGFYTRNSGFSASGSQQQMEIFQPGNSFGNGNWASLYHNIYDLNFVMTSSTAGSVLPGAARVLRIMDFQDLVDQFGNIPYRQAAQPDLTLTPVYDKDADVYKDLVLQLDTAITVLQASKATADDASDIMFKGDKNLWIKLANTLKLRILLRQMPKGDPNYVKTELSKIATQGSGFLGAGQDAAVNPGYADVTTQQNPFWTAYGFLPGTTTGVQGYDAFCANDFMLSFCDSVADPRKAYFYGKNSQGTYGGNNFGDITNSAKNTSPFGPGILQSASQSSVLLSASQSLLMQAEAVQRGLMNGSASGLFKQGVEESFRLLAVQGGTAAADAYMAGSTNGMVNFQQSADPLRAILIQKWLSECCLDGLEAYSDYRRTGVPFFPNPSLAVPGVAIPKRILYPQTEYTQNVANVNAQNQTGADLYTPIFWGL